MDTHSFTLFGRKFQAIVGITDSSGQHTVTVKSCDKFIPKKLMCYVNPANEFIEIYVEKPAPIAPRSSKWEKLETGVKYKMSEYRFAELLGKWMALTYLTLEQDTWFKNYIPQVSEQSGYKIYKSSKTPNIIAENETLLHKVEFLTKTEEDGIRYIAKDNKGMHVEQFSFYKWEYERFCVGLPTD